MKAHEGAAPFFRGWYYKHQLNGRTLAFIPGIRADEGGHRSAFVQIITERNSWQADYPASDFFASGDRVRVGRSLFTPTGSRVDIRTALFACKGVLRYGPGAPPKYDAMGPFRWLPMECSHGVVSLAHSLSGGVRLCGEELSFDGGTGYIEKDWGRSFPKSYLWVQSNDFSGKRCSVMVSVAEVPLPGGSIRGCIGMVWLAGREYRLATYTGVRVAACGPAGVVLRQGGSLLEIRLLRRPEPGAKLLAPVRGRMCRTIRECASCGARFRFQRGGKVLLDAVSPHASFEYVKALDR